ncbi:MAG: uracil-DNA glycosylase [Hyphomicrobiaceae bacterium]
MSNQKYRSELLRRVHEPHVTRINALVEELRGQGRGSVPYVAPTYGGVKAEALFIFRDPGPATQKSCMLCHQNDDQSAQRFSEWLAEAGIHPDRVLTWNAYPWYINGDPSEEQLNASLASLDRLLILLTGLKVVVLCGRPAQNVWSLLMERDPHRKRPVCVLHAPHTSHMGLLNYEGRGYRENIAFAKQQFAKVAEIIGSSTT